jgi:1-acyl-sn-glycerol-3-phosphate acyltransferase
MIGACLRAGLILATLLFFFVFVTPFQILAVRLSLPVAAYGQFVLCRALLFFLRVDVGMDGVPSPRRPRLIIANHISWLDILVFGAIEPLCFLAKQEVSTWPLIASFAKAQRTVFVDRKRRRSIPGANRTMAARMSEGRSVLLFPEGTTYNGKALGKFHSSHLAAARDLLANDHETEAVSVQPAALFYSAPHAGWTGDATLIPHLWEILCRPPLMAHVVFAKPLLYERGSDRKVLCAGSKAAIEALLQTHWIEQSQPCADLIRASKHARRCRDGRIIGRLKGRPLDGLGRP